MKKKLKSSNKMTVGESIVAGTISLIVTMAASWVARGGEYAITSSKRWKEKIYPWIKKTYNKCEDWRDEAIDEVKEMFNKKNN
jgi:mannose/fructose/N-acetylgalactosamine-specific phosphotransferase system component IID